MAALEPSRRETRILTAIFLLALGFHALALTYNWRTPNLSGHEFRQAQTAITTYYIDRQDNFGLLYETPILGKPWVSILMEVPVYEWAVVALSRATGLPHYLAARTISATCFYLALPAIYLLLARLGLARPRRLFVLALVLTCPVYIYYSRAFLMDSMAFMASAWFLLGFVRTMDERRPGWLALTTVAGTAAALIKSAVLAAWLLPAAGYGAWLLWRDLRAGPDWRAAGRTVLWGAATVIVALGALRAWIVYTDPLKAAHDSAWIFTSKNLSQGNWGLFDFKSLFSAKVWGFLLGCWDQAIMSRWLLIAALAAGLALPAARRPVLAFGGLFLLAQAMFPYAYAYQDYYFYTCAVFANVAVGFLLLVVWDSRAPRWAAALVCAVPFGAQLAAYHQHYWAGQRIQAPGGYPFTDAIRDLTPKDSVLIVAGADWAAMTPLYSQRRALMVRNGLEYDAAYLQRAFDHLAGENVSALVLMGDARRNRQFLELVARRFDLDPAQPTFSWTIADVYLPRPIRKAVQMRMKATGRYPLLDVPRTAADDLPAKGRLRLSPEVGHNVFWNIVPAPHEAEFEYGLGWVEHGDGAVLSLHPHSNLWLHPPAAARRIVWRYGIFDGAFANPAAHTDGVEFIIDAEKPDGSTRRIFYRLLDPAAKPEDRGDQRSEIPYLPEPGETLHVFTLPNRHSTFDWAYLVDLQVDEVPAGGGQ